MRHIFSTYRLHFSDKAFVRSFFLALVFVVASLLFNHFASSYATRVASSPVTDLFLDNVPTINVDWIVNEGAVLFIMFILALLFLEPKKAPFVLKAGALFVAIRAGFITFTHLGVVPDHIPIDPAEMIDRLTIGGDYFFSGHTGFPFLMALLFWNEKRVRMICLAASVILGVSMLLGHIHYSIDVLSAYFITYTIYVLAKRFFTQDLALFFSRTEVGEGN